MSLNDARRQMNVGRRMAAGVATVALLTLGLSTTSIMAAPAAAAAPARTSPSCEPSPDGGNLCVLGTNLSYGVQLRNPNTKLVTAHDIFVNTGGSRALYLRRDNTEVVSTGGRIGTVGGVDRTSNTVIDPAAETGLPPQPDPFLTQPEPPPDASTGVTTQAAACAQTGHPNIDQNGTDRVLAPGVYNNIRIRNATMTLEPGVYTIKGQFNADTGSTVVGKGVTLYFCSSSSERFLTQNGAHVLITAPGGPTDFAIWVNANTSNNDTTMRIRSTTQIIGRVYMATGGIRIDTAASLVVSGDVVVRGPVLIYTSGSSLNVTGGEALPPSLTLTKAPGSEHFVAGGAPVTYTLTVRNGPVEAHGVKLTDELPAGFEFVEEGSSPSCGFDSGTRVVTCDIGTVAADDTVTRHIAVRALASAEQGIRENIARVSANDIPEAVAGAEIDVVRQFNVSIKKLGPGTVTAGNSIKYTLEVTNTGPSDAAVTVTDSLPFGESPVSMTPVPTTRLTCNAQMLTCTGTLPANSVTTVTVTADTSPNLTAENGPLTNTAKVQTEGGTNSAPAEDQESTAETAVATHADLTLEKVRQTSPVVAGQPVFYKLTVGNDGPSLARNVTITDTLPAGTTFLPSPNGSSPECTEESAGPPVTVICSGLGDLPPQQTRDVVIAISLPANTPEGTPLHNSAVAGSSTPNNAPPASDNATVTRVSGISLNKQGPDTPVDPDGPISYNMTVTNDGPSAADVTVTDNEPNHVTFTNAASTDGFTCTGPFSPTVTCTFDNMPAHSTAHITITGTVANDAPPGANIHNIAVATIGGNEVTRDTEDTHVSKPTGLELTKTPSIKEVVAGHPLSYTLTVTNHGPGPANNVTLTDSIPAGFVPDTPAPNGCSFNNGHSELTCTFATIPEGPTTVTLNGTVSPSAAGLSPLENEAKVEGTVNGQSDSDTANASVHVIAEYAFLIAKEAVTNPVTAGGPAKWKITVTNQGPSDFHETDSAFGPLVVYDASDSKVTLTGLTSNDAGVTCSDGTCEITSLPAGGSVTITASGDVHPDASGTITNTATVLTPNGPETTSPPAVVDVVRDVGLKVTKHAPETVVAGGEIQYAIEVHNSGPSDATAVTVTDTLPAQLAFTGETPPCTAVGQDVTCHLGPILAGGTSWAFITADVSPDAAGSTLHNTAFAQADVGPRVPSTETATKVGPQIPVTISKAPDEVGVAGRDLSWTIRVLNQDSETATGVTVQDTLPKGLTFVRATSTTPGVECTPSDGHFSCTLPDMPQGTRVTITLLTHVPADFIPVGTKVVEAHNVAEVQSNLGGPPSTDSARADIKAQVNLIPSKSASPNPVRAGTELTYTLGMTNHGPSYANNPFTEDTLPPGVQFLPARSDSRCHLATASSDMPRNTVICRVTRLGPGQSATFDVVVRVSPTAFGNLVNVSVVGSEAENLNKAPVSPPVIVTVVRPGEVPPPPPPTTPGAPEAPGSPPQVQATPPELAVTGLPAVPWMLEAAVIAIGAGLLMLAAGTLRRRRD